jgi:hypothetical protein
MLFSIWIRDGKIRIRDKHPESNQQSKLFSVPREGKRTQIMQKNEDLSLARVITRVNSSQNSLLTCINNMVFTYVKSLKLVIHLVHSHVHCLCDV